MVAPAGKVGIIVGGRIKYVDRPGAKAAESSVKPARAKAEKPPKPKYDPKYLTAARELRDRCMERVNDSLLLPSTAGKYDVARALGAVEGASIDGTSGPTAVPALPAPRAA